VGWWTPLLKVAYGAVGCVGYIDDQGWLWTNGAVRRWIKASDKLAPNEKRLVRCI